jgi:hypothetical protein
MVLPLQAQISQITHPSLPHLRASGADSDVAVAVGTLTTEAAYVEDAELLTNDMTSSVASVVRRLDLDVTCREKVVSLNAEKNADSSVAKRTAGQSG